MTRRQTEKLPFQKGDEASDRFGRDELVCPDRPVLLVHVLLPARCRSIGSAPSETLGIGGHRYRGDRCYRHVKQSDNHTRIVSA